MVRTQQEFRPALASSLKVAHAVLRYLHLPRALRETADVVGYENGREHGLALRVFLRPIRSLTICWSECRNSDQIVVYVSNVDEPFEGNTNIPTDRAYKAARYFGPEDAVEAAAYIRAAVIAASE